jgi:hypothetical protein
MITGKTGTTLNAFPGGNVVAVDYRGRASLRPPTGMTVAKIRRARKILAQNYVNMQQQLYIAMTSQQIEDLTNDAKATDGDYAQQRTSRNGAEDGKYLMGLAGFKFIEIELGNPLLYAEYGGTDITVDGALNRKCPFFTRTAWSRASGKTCSPTSRSCRRSTLTPRCIQPHDRRVQPHRSEPLRVHSLRRIIAGRGEPPGRDPGG